MNQILDEGPVLALNCGSSSLKFGLYQTKEDGIELLCEGEAEDIGDKGCFWWKTPDNSSRRTEEIQLPDHSAALLRTLDALKTSGTDEPRAVGHRIVHGGPRVREHRLLDENVLTELRAAVPYAPLHLPASLAVVDTMRERAPGIPQAVCIDTAFHAHLPEVSKTLPLPADIRNMGVERYGFHGLSLESILAQLDPVPERLIVAHLGSGSSITAIRQGRSIDTTMGLTPTGGVMMGTRPGDLDPGVVLYLMRHGYKDVEALEKMLDHGCGLRGVSEKSGDVRDLSKARKTDPKADLALRMFCYQIRKSIAGMAAAMGGIGTVVFTGGIGEHAAELRNEICSGLEFLGRFKTLMLPAQEDLQIAKITLQLTGVGVPQPAA